MRMLTLSFGIHVHNFAARAFYRHWRDWHERDRGDPADHGDAVSGSDLRRSAVTDRLAGLGATIYEGHAAANAAAAMWW